MQIWKVLCLKPLCLIYTRRPISVGLNLQRDDKHLNYIVVQRKIRCKVNKRENM